MIVVWFLCRKIWSLVTREWKKEQGQWRPRCVGISRFQPPRSNFGSYFLCGRLFASSGWPGFWLRPLLVV